MTGQADIVIKFDGQKTIYGMRYHGGCIFVGPIDKLRGPRLRFAVLGLLAQIGVLRFNIGINKAQLVFVYVFFVSPVVGTRA